MKIAQCVSTRLRTLWLLGGDCSMQGFIEMEMRAAQCRNAADLNEFIEDHVGIREVTYSGAHNFMNVLQYFLRW